MANSKLCKSRSNYLILIFGLIGDLVVCSSVEVCLNWQRRCADQVISVCGGNSSCAFRCLSQNETTVFQGAFLGKQKWLPENDPLTCLYPEKWVVGERQGLYRKADLHRLVFTFRRGTWKKLFFKLYCTEVDAHVTQVVDATQDNSDPIQLNVECSWTIFAKHPESCEVLKLAYATDNNFSNTVTFPRPRTERPFFYQTRVEEPGFIFPTWWNDTEISVCLGDDASKSLSPTKVYLADASAHCTEKPGRPLMIKKKIPDGSYYLRIMVGENQSCLDYDPSPKFRFSVQNDAQTAAGTRIGILVGFGASGLLSLVLLILFVKMHRKKQGMVLWVTNVTWAEHFQLFEDLFKRINDLSVFENKNLLELMKKTSQNLEMELRKCRAVVLVVGPRHFPELEDWWKEAYPQVLRYLVLEKYAKKLVIVKPSYFEEQIQMRGRHTVIYNGKNLEDVAEAIVGEDFALLEMIGARSYSTLWVAQKTSAFVKAEIRVLKYKAKFDASQLQLVHQQDDY